MSPRRRLLFWTLVAVQALVPLGLIAWNEVALAHGTEVVLRTAPVDPLDLFRGRYVTLSYEISSLPATGARDGDTVYVALRRSGDRWTGDAATLTRPAGGTFIRGTYTGSRIEYGIETYYADEDEARRLEREARDRLDVRVVLDDDGKARIEDMSVR